MATNPAQRVTKGGITLTRRMWALLAQVEKEAKVDLIPTQGSFNRGGVQASAGTHDGGGAIDISIRNLTRTQALRVVAVYRKYYGDAWLRTEEFGWSGAPHMHVIVADEPGLSDGARAQVSMYNRGLNGLKGGNDDPHPRPSKRYHFQMPGSQASPHLLHLLHLAHLASIPGHQMNERPLTRHELHVLHVWNTQGVEIK